MSYSLKFTLEGLPKLVSNGAHGSWKSKAAHKRLWKNRVILACRLEGVPDVPLEKAQVRMTRHSWVEPDFDNLAISFKPLLDGLKVAGVIKDDKRENIGKPDYEWARAPIKQGFITIEVVASQG